MGVIATCLILLSACGNGRSTSNGNSPDTGPLAFNVVYRDAVGYPDAQASVIDCAGQGIATVQAAVYDADNVFLAGFCH